MSATLLSKQVIDRATASRLLPSDPSRWSNSQVTAAWCIGNGVPVVPVHPSSVDRKAFQTHRENCLLNRWLPTFFADGVAVVATPHPWDPTVARCVRKALRCELYLFGAVELDFDRTVGLLEAESLEKEVAVARVPESVPTRWVIPNCKPDDRGKELVLEMVRAAWRCDASDLFVNQVESVVNVSARISGVVEVFPPVPALYGGDVMNAIRQIAGVNSSNRTAPVDASFECAVAPGYSINLRVAICPMYGGETVTLRLLDARRHASMVKNLPFTEPLLSTVHGALRSSQGLVLVTGPTGSGKTTTLYACLSQFDRSEKVLRSAEDPVEYPIEGVTQIAVNGNTGRTFASVLKFFLRSAPNALLVGEIRDSETANLCVELSLTGHLVLSTLHTNDCPGTVTRLLGLGVPLPNVSSVVSLILAQRLLPKLCPVCRSARAPTLNERNAFAAYDIEPPETVYSRMGCPNCSFVGIRGRVPIFEAMEGSVLRAVPLESWSELALRREWRRQNGVSLAQSALVVAKDGSVEMTEALRYWRPNE